MPSLVLVREVLTEVNVQPELRSYLVANVPGWLLATLAAWAAVRWLDIGVWVAAALVLAWVIKDLLLFPMMRRFYRPEPTAERMVGEQGVVLNPLNPQGFVRVRGEIWQARAAGDGGPQIPKGTAVRVREIHGLLLIVEPQTRRVAEDQDRTR